MLVEKLKPVKSMWIEDSNGDLVANETEIMQNEVPPCFEKDFKDPRRYAHFRSAGVTHTCFSEKSKKNPNGEVFRGECTVGACGKSIASLVLDHGWNLNDACVLYSVLCSDCMNTLSAELEGFDYNEKSSTWCEHCSIIRPDTRAGQLTSEEYHTNAKLLSELGHTALANSLYNDTTFKAKRISRNKVTGFYKVEVI